MHEQSQYVAPGPRVPWYLEWTNILQEELHKALTQLRVPRRRLKARRRSSYKDKKRIPIITIFILEKVVLVRLHYLSPTIRISGECIGMKKYSLERRRIVLGYILVIPSNSNNCICVALSSIVRPLYELFRVTVGRSLSFNFVGFKNYVDVLFDSSWWGAF